jgi:TolB protein
MAVEPPPSPGSRRRLTTRRQLLASAIGAGGAALAACGLSPQGDGGAVAGRLDGAPAVSGNGPGAAPPGRLLFVGDANIWLWEKGGVRRLTGDRLSRQPAWSPDGKRIAHVKIDTSSSEIWVMDADGANSRRLTQNTDERVLARNNWAFRPIWWPDGSRLLYLSDETTRDLMLWQIGLDGRNRRPFLTIPDLEGGMDMPSLSPDARRIALVLYRGPGGRSQVWSYTFATRQWQQLTETPEGAYDPAWSPDGTRIAYTVRNRGRHDIWVMDADGLNAQPVTDSGTCRAPCWSPDGQYLAFISAEGGSFDLWVLPAPAPAAQAAQAGQTSSPAARREARPLTKGAQLDAVSGLSWTR